jgi:hypothetical protein
MPAGASLRRNSLMRGRHPSGPEFVDKLDGSPEAKQRLKALLLTLAGSQRVLEACEELGIKEARFDQIRIETLQAALQALEPKLPGRKPQISTPDAAEIDQLRQRVAALEAQLEAALLRAEIAVTLPQVGALDEKKTANPSPRTKKRS